MSRHTTSPTQRALIGIVAFIVIRSIFWISGVDFSERSVVAGISVLSAFGAAFFAWNMAR